MINFITPYEDREALYAGAEERLMFWAFIRHHFRGARRYWVSPGYANPAKRYTLGLLRVFWLLIKMAFHSNRVFVFCYPNFPFMPTQGWLNYWLGMIFFLSVKTLALTKRGEVAILIADAPRLARGDVIDDYDPVAGQRMMRLFEKVVFGLADLLWVTSHPQREWFASDLNLDSRKIHVAINGAPRSIESVEPANLEEDGWVNFVYAGSLARVKGIQAMLDAFGKMKNRNARLFLTGIEGDWIPGTCDDPRVHYLGCLPSPDEAAAVVKACDVAIVPYAPKPFSNIMFPTKLSFYIVCGTPILTSDIRETARIVEENQIGLSCPVERMPQMMDYMVEHPEQRDRFRQNCKRIKDEFFWETIFDKALGDLFPEEYPKGKSLTIRLGAQ